MVGEIYLAKIYFTNGNEFKIRPVLLLKPNSFSDILYVPLTSNINTKGIVINNKDLKDGYLPKISVIVYEKIGVIDQKLLIKKIGTLNDISVKQIIAKLLAFFSEATE